jgi:hypothetical protein
VTRVRQNHTAAGNISMGFLPDRHALKWLIDGRSPTPKQIPELTGAGALGPGIGLPDGLDNLHNKLDNNEHTLDNILVASWSL